MNTKRIVARVSALIWFAALIAMGGCAETDCIAGVGISFGIILLCTLIINRLPGSVWD